MLRWWEVYIDSISLLAFYYKRSKLIGYATRYTFPDRQWVNGLTVCNGKIIKKNGIQKHVPCLVIKKMAHVDLNGSYLSPNI